MRNFKKFLTLVLAVMMVVSAMSFTTSAAVTKFEDVDAGNEALVKAVDLLEYMGITKGVSETQFGADQAVTREQFALFMYRLMKGGKNAPANASNTTKFADLEDKTYFYAISWANAQGIINGTSDTTFHPKNGITLQDAYTMVVRALDYEEEEELIYPHGYIDVAEQDGVELDAGLASTLSYEDTLTRGDMAIILYNAFFAETGVPTTYHKIVGDLTDNNVDYIREEVTYETLCEKHFDVKEVVFEAAATPHYALAVDSEDPTYDLGLDAIYFNTVSVETANAADEVSSAYYIEAADIGLEGENLDDYFLGHFTMFITTDEEKEIEKILFSDCNMVKKTVNDLKLATVSSNKAASYYGGSDSKLLSGKITTGAETIYAFNAPYTYIKPDYVKNSSDAFKYWQRNANDIIEINYEIGNDGDVDYYLVDFEEVVTAGAEYDDVMDEFVFNKYDVDGITEIQSDEEDPYFTLQAEELLAKFEQVYYDGLYEADLYDVDGDGVYEYIDYKPYILFQVDSDEDYDFSDSTNYDVTDPAYDSTELPYVYTNEANVIGAEFADEDLVIGYVDALTNTVKVAEVIKPTVSSISKFVKKSGSVVLADGTPVNVGSAWKLLENLKMNTFGNTIVYEDLFEEAVVATAQASELFDADMLEGEEVELYIYNGVVLHFDGINSNLKFSENLIIPLHLDEAGAAINGNEPEKDFNKETGERIWYIYAWVDGVTKYVPVVTEDVEPEVINNSGDLTSDYDGQLCTYTVDADGIYTIKSLGYDLDDKTLAYKGVYTDGYNNIELEDDDDAVEDVDVTDDRHVLNSKEEDVQYLVKAENDVKLVKEAGTRFYLDGATEIDRDLIIKSYTKMVIRTWNDKTEKYEIEVLDASQLKASAETPFTYVTYLIGNNPNSKSKEDLIVLYATVDNSFELEVKKDKNGQRIVRASTPGLDDNGYYRNYYELINPFTGAIESEIAGNDSSKSAGALTTPVATGWFVELKGGMVDEEAQPMNATIDADNDATTPEVENKDYIGRINTNDDDGLVWITEYDEADDFITVVPVEETAGVTCKDCFEEAIENFKLDNTYLNFSGKAYEDEFEVLQTKDSIFYEVTKDTAVVVIKYSSRGTSTTEWGSVTLGDLSTIADAKKDYKCYSEKMEDSKGNLVTKYAPYLMAYVSASEGEDEDEDLPVADFIIVVVNPVDDNKMLMSAKEAYEAGNSCAHTAEYEVQA